MRPKRQPGRRILIKVFILIIVLQCRIRIMLLFSYTLILSVLKYVCARFKHLEHFDKTFRLLYVLCVFETDLQLKKMTEG